MNILHLIQLNPKKIGSFEDYLIILAHEAQAKGIQISIMFEGKVPDYLEYKYSGIQLFVLSGKRGTLVFYKELIKIIKKSKFDIVHISFYPIFSEIPIFLHLLGVKKIFFTDHVSGNISHPLFLKRFFVMLKNKIILKFIYKIICVSKFVLTRNKNTPSMDHSKLELIYNGVNLNRFNQNQNMQKTKLEFNLSQEKFIVSTAINLIEEKGIYFLIEAAGKIVNKFSNIIFLIVGEGKESHKLSKKIEELNLNKHVLFLGLRNDVERILSVSDIFVYPSIWEEAFGLAIIEAMGCGVPVIASNVGGIPEIIEHDYSGLLINPKDSSAIADSIEYLYNNFNVRERIKNNAKKVVEEKFNLNVIVNKTLNLYMQ